MLTATTSGSIRAWPIVSPGIVTGRSSKQLVFAPGHSDNIVFMDACDDGHCVAAATEDGIVAIWNLRNPLKYKIYSPSSDNSSIYGITVSPSGDYVAVGGDTPRLWAIDESGEPDQSPIYLKGHEKVDGSSPRVLSLEISPDGRILVTAGGDSLPRIWDLQKSVFNGLDQFILPRGLSAAAVSLNLRWIVTRGRPNYIWFINENGDINVPVPITGHDGWINEFVFNQDNNMMLTSGEDGKVIMWSLGPTGQVKLDRVLGSHKGEVYGVSFSADSRWVATGGADGKVLLTAIKGDGLSPQSLELIPGGAVMSLFDKQARSGRPLNSTSLLQFSADGHWLAAASANGTISVWDVSSDQPQQDPLILEGHTGELSTLLFSADNRKLISAGTDKIATVWDLAAKNPSIPVAIMPGHTGLIHSVAMSPNNRFVVTGGGHIVDNQGLDTQHSDSRVIIWDLLNTDTTATAWELQGHKGWIHNITFNHAGNILATLGDDGIRIWTFDGKIPKTPIFIACSASTLFFTSGDDSLVALTRRVNVYELDLTHMLDNALKIAGRQFTIKEWQEFFPVKPISKK